MQPPEATFRIIDSFRYRRIKPFLVAVLIVNPILAVFLPAPDFIPAILSGLFIGTCVYMKWQATNWKRLGAIRLLPDSIWIQMGDEGPQQFPISDLSAFTISRGTEFHYDRWSFFTETHDNRITFEYQDQKYSYEFCIRNKKENDVFEKWIREYRLRYPAFYYSSI